MAVREESWVQGRCARELLPSGPSWQVVHLGEGPGVDFGPIRVPIDHVFVLGDNRDNSQDSRHFGAFPLSRVLGRAKVVFFSLDDRGVHWARAGEVGSSRYMNLPSEMR